MSIWEKFMKIHKWMTIIVYTMNAMNIDVVQRKNLKNIYEYALSIVKMKYFMKMTIEKKKKVKLYVYQLFKTQRACETIPSE